MLASRVTAEFQKRNDESLSRREIEILIHLREGRGDKQIAAALGLSTKTIQHHVWTLCHKLAAANRTHAVVIALRLKIIALA